MGRTFCTHGGQEKGILRGLGIYGEDNIKVNLKEIECEGVEWIQLESHNRVQWWAVVNTVMNFRVS
jgi:hypothetical protein